MALTLTITNQPFTDTKQQSTFRFERDGSIGRSEKCTWMLHDPSRYISAKHAAISLRGGMFYIMDTSTNGLYVNNKLIGKGNATQLNHGDELRIGQFEIKAAIDSALKSPHASSHRPEVNLGDLALPVQRPIVSDKLSLMDILEKKDTPSLGNGNPSPPRGPSVNESSSLIPKNIAPPSANPGRSSSDRSHVLGQHFAPPPVIPDDWYFSDKSLSSTPMQNPDERLPVDSGPILPPTSSKRSQPESANQLPVSGSGNQEILQALLDGMGIPAHNLNPNETKEFAYTVGQVVRNAIEGMVTILRARTTFKSEFRIEMTTIRSQQNNPLKFSIGTDEVLKQLFFSQNNSYLPPLQSLQEGIQDMQAHQIAMMAGMQAALKDLLKQFDPARLEKQFEKLESNKKLLAGSKKSQNWDAYARHYQQLLQHIQDDYHTYFGKTFVAVYEEQIAKLKSMGKTSI